MRWAFGGTDGPPQLVANRLRPMIEPGGLRANLVPLAVGWQRAQPTGSRIAFADLERSKPEAWGDPDGNLPTTDLWSCAYAEIIEPDDGGMIRMRLAKGDAADWFPAATILVAGIDADAWARLEAEGWPTDPGRARGALKRDRRLILSDHPKHGPISWWRPRT